MKRVARSVRWLPLPLAALVALLMATLSATPGIRQDPTTEVVQGHPAAAAEVLVKLRGSPADNVFADIAREVDADHHRPVGGTGVRLFHSRRFTAGEMVASLSKRGNVEYAEPNYIVRVLQGPADPQFPKLWGLQNVGQAVNGAAAGTEGADIHAVPAWQVSTGSRDIVVAVVDTGIDYTHTDLAPNVWSAPAPFSVTLGGTTISCAAGTHGFNAIARTCDPMDDHNHGTHVSGTIGAVGNNSTGVVGVNWTTAIMGAKFIGADGSGSTADAIEAIEFTIQAKAAFASAAAANVRVLSNSWGGASFSQALLDEINRAGDNDMLFVAAAGNNGVSNDTWPMYPASYAAANIVAVAATDNADARAVFSNYGAKTVHLGAPGVDILSTTIGDTYTFFSGTSMATPHVAGSAALALSGCAFDTTALKGDLLSTVDLVTGLSGNTITGGRLNVDRAIRACTEEPGVPAGLTAMAGNGLVTLAWTPSAGAMTYQVKRSTVAGGPYTTVANVSPTGYVDRGVANDVTYYYVVSAGNLVGTSADSAEVSATPKIPPDLIVSALVLPAAAGAGDVISVTDTTTNQGGGVAAASTTRFYLSTNGALDSADTPLEGGRAVPALAAGASSSAPTSVTLPAGVAPRTWYVIAKADADNGSAETSETNNTISRAIVIGPDLVVTGLQAPTAVAPGSVVSITDTVKNQGGGIAGVATTRFYLSPNTVLDATDTLLNGSRTVPALALGASSSGTTSLTIPGELVVGTYYLIAKADADNAVAETSETNNTAARATQAGPDLIVSAFTTSAAAAAGGTIAVSDTVKNQGSATAAGSTTRFYLSANTTLDTTDTVLDGSRVVAALAAGATDAGATSLTLPPDLAVGIYYVIAKTDADNVVVETVETNNSTARAIAIGPDLFVSALQAPSTVAPGSVISITDTVRNQGASAAGSSLTRFYLSANTALDAADTSLDASRTVAALGAGATSSGTTLVTIPTGLEAGTFYIIAKADCDNAVAETYENNNTSARGIGIGPDLVVSALQTPSNVASGSVVSVTDTIKNQGAAAAGTSTTRFYLSTNGTLDAGDVRLEGNRAVPFLASAASSSGTTSVTVPAGLAVGTYYLIAKADADGVVSETSEANNTSARPVQVGPDLIVSTTSMPSSAPSGGSILVVDTIKNMGLTAANPSTTRFYLSTNGILDVADTLLDGSRAVAALAAGASSTGSTSLTIPAGLAPGTYYIFTKADADGVVTETTESNNAAVRPITITAGT